MNTKSQIILIAMFALTLAGCGVKNSEQDQAAVGKIRLDFIAAFNAGDIKGIEPLIDQNAVWQIPGHPLITGKENIVARYADAFAASQSTIDLKPGDIQLCDDWALLNGDFTRTDRLKPDNTVRYFTGHYLFACKKQTDGTWKITRDIWNETEVADLSSKLPVPDHKMMIVAKLSVKPDKARDFTAAAKDMIAKSNQEAGCSFYQLYQNPYDPSKFVFVEEYKNQAAVDEHFSTDYFQAFGPKISNFVSGPAEIKIITVAKEALK